MKDCCAIIIDNIASGSRNLRRAIEMISDLVDETVVLTGADEIGSYNSPVKIIPICGGENFAALVKLGINSICRKYSVVAVHDTAQPFEISGSINRVFESAKCCAAIAGTKAVDTIKVVNNGVISQTINRNLVWSVSSPFVLDSITLKQLCDTIILKSIDCHNTASFATQCFRLGLQIKIIERTEKNDSNS